MVEKDDWRLRGQEENLFKKKLYLRTWTQVKEDWDHDHCDFCWDKFSEYPEDMHEGYTTEDNYSWICPKCVEDFKDMFQWIFEDKKD
ncbi:MAG TPA: hypothetical protein DEG42_00610 [Acholeplasmataceae bacterium]|nr:hypothetical protein [Acholeplasmataceae bacterium]